MRWIARGTGVVLVMATGIAAGHAESAPAPVAAPSPAWAAARPGPLLGRAHLWVKIGRMDLDEGAAGAWGVDHERYLALEGYRGFPSDFYFGGEIGHARDARSTTADGDTIRDFNLLWLEMNEKKAFELRRGLTIDLGVGCSFFYADGEEVTTQGGQEVADPLADIGFGVQAFADLNWRMRRLLVGLDARYQRAFDIIEINYSNLRIGAHIGLAF